MRWPTGHQVWINCKDRGKDWSKDVSHFTLNQMFCINSCSLSRCRQFSAFTMDVIARCAFGMKLDNLGEKGDPFMEKARQVFSPPAMKSPAIILPCKCHRDDWCTFYSFHILTFFFSVMSPILMKLFGERMFASGFHYFTKILEGLVKDRASSNEVVKV